VPRPRSLAVVLSVAFAFALVFLAPDVPDARAQNPKVEAAAKALQKKAMEEDYLATEFGKAQDKLDKAIAQCGTEKCSAGLRAALRRDLGVVQIGGQIDKEKGIGNFVEALKLDPNVKLDPDLRTKDLDAAFAEAKKRAAGGAPSSGGGTGDQPSGDFKHDPAAEQQIRTPIPVYAEYSGEEQLAKVIVRYKGFGMTDWKTVELKKMGDKGWGGLIPCADVQQGTALYYLQGFNAANDPVATGGDRNNPYKVPVKTDKPADPPHLPNAAPPTQCADTGDCPPNFPGCKKGTGPAVTDVPGKDGGEFCEEDSECRSKSCVQNKCTSPDSGMKGPKIFVGIFGALDYTFVPSSEDVCKLRPDAFPLNENNYYCSRKEGDDYPYRPSGQGDTDPRVPENGQLVSSSDKGSDKVSGGGALGNIRVMLSLDYAVTPNVLIGGRVGVVLNRYPADAAEIDGNRFALPIHVELRGTYVLGKDALAKPGFAPYFFGGAGISSWETRVPVSVVEAPPAQPRQAKDVDAWHIAGPAFIAVGGGGRFAITQKAAILGGLRANFAFGNAFAPSVGPELGAQIGF
jgi:hypothetical protein